MVASVTDVAPERLLARFGLDEFRPGQREAVLAALHGRDSLVVMPTGAGKSLCYQLPALADERLVLVVSPLIALIDDQRRRLADAGVRAAMLSSASDAAGNAQALADIASGAAQLALVAPERFASKAFREALSQRPLALFVVDEAHCVAEWGHDFRPDYLRLRAAIDALGRPPVMATTATATPRVAAEIAARLGLRDHLSVSSGFDRPNIAFDVVRFEGKGALARKRAVLSHVLGEDRALPAIVYAGTRKDTDELAQSLSASGIAAVAYHAGLPAERRAAAQEDFMSGRVHAIVATNAFGMGVDKPDVRSVVHWALPTSLEAYYQEAGRGGRDGQPARAVLLAARMDLGRLIRVNTERRIEVDSVRRYIAWLARGAHGASSVLRKPSDAERVPLSIAERAGAVALHPGGGGALQIELTGAFDGDAAYRAIKVAKDRGWEAYRAIERFASSDSCRRRQILDHFGDEEPTAPSGRCCDVCDPDPSLQAALASAVQQPSARSGARLATRSGMRGSSPAGTSAPRTRAPAPTRDDLSQPQTEVFERLRTWRRQRAEGKPAYTVASDATLVRIVSAMPASRQELLAIDGVGPHFCQTHAESLLAELARA